MRRSCALAAAILSSLLALPAGAATTYPLTLRNCGADVVIPHAPRRAVSIGQATTEVLYSLGLADRVVGTAVWFGPVLPQFAAVNAGIERLADNDPSFESVVGLDPDLVAAQYQWHVGPHGSVGTVGQFRALGIPAYVAPADCAAKDNAAGGDGVRVEPLTAAPILQEIHELAAIFDVSAAGDALAGRLQAQEREAVASAAGTPRGQKLLFWFSSRTVTGDPFVAGRNGAPAYIMRALGERNVIEADDEWPTVSWERIAAADPDVIVVARMDRRRFPADDVDVKLDFLRTDPVAREIAAVRRNHVVVMDAQSMNPGMRMVDGIAVLAAALRRFADETPGAAR